MKNDKKDLNGKRSKTRYLETENRLHPKVKKIFNNSIWDC